MDDAEAPPPQAPSCPGDPAGLVALPRPVALALAPDGRRLVAVVQELAADGARYTGALWEYDPAGERVPRRLTAAGESAWAPHFGTDGALRHLARGADGPEVRLAAPGAPARVVARHPGGIGAFTEAAGTLAWTAGLLPGAAGPAEHAEQLRRRELAGVDAVLYDPGPVMEYGGPLGPQLPHVLARRADGETLVVGGQGRTGGGAPALSPDGTLVAFTRGVTRPDADDVALVVAETATGAERLVVDRPGHQYYRPAFSADGRTLLCERQREETWEEPWEVTMVALDPATGAERDLLEGADLWPWPGRPVPSPVPGDATVWFTGDRRGHCPVFRRDADGTVTRLTATGAYEAVCVAPDARTLYALRSAIDSPPRVVRLDAAAPGEPAYLDRTGPLPVPGTLTEVTAAGDDGFPLRGHLVLPPGAGPDAPAPLLVMAHGGPQSSWRNWSRGVSPWPFAARGWAVLLADPALSTGYGRRMQERGHGDWGGRPLADLLALTDAAAERPDVDGDRAALAGNSYGGYLVNRAATRTRRYRAHVSYAGTWHLESAVYTHDLAPFNRRVHGDPLTRRERLDANSPHLDADALAAPVLLVHGGRDTRVPPGQSTALLEELRRRGVPARLLLFPGEAHNVEGPGNSRVLHETMLAFLAQHVLGRPWERPALL